MYRKFLLAALATLAMVLLTSPTPSSASTRCAGGSDFVTRGGYDVSLSSYHNNHGMRCSSVRYVARYLQHKIQRQYSWPHIGGPFYDGYVTWHCYKLSSLRWSCEEYTSYTSFSFTGQVY